MNSLKKDSEFQIIYNSGKKSFGYYSLIFFKKNDEKLKKCGFVASKKVGNAVCRNRVKRLFRTYWQKNECLIKDGYSVIIVAKKTAGIDIKKIKYKDIEKDLNKIMKYAKILRK